MIRRAGADGGLFVTAAPGFQEVRSELWWKGDVPYLFLWWRHQDAEEIEEYYIVQPATQRGEPLLPAPMNSAGYADVYVRQWFFRRDMRHFETTLAGIRSARLRELRHDFERNPAYGQAPA